MKTTLQLLIMILFGYASLAYGAGAEKVELSPAMIIFLCFLALFLVGQLLPGVILFWSMLKGLFTRAGSKRSATVTGKPSQPS